MKRIFIYIFFIYIKYLSSTRAVKDYSTPILTSVLAFQFLSTALEVTCCRAMSFLLLCFTAEMLTTSPEMTLPSDGVGVVDEEREFVWDDYLEDTKSTAAPATSFKHVRAALIIANNS